MLLSHVHFLPMQGYFQTNEMLINLVPRLIKFGLSKKNSFENI